MHLVCVPHLNVCGSFDVGTALICCRSIQQGRAGAWNPQLVFLAAIGGSMCLDIVKLLQKKLGAGAPGVEQLETVTLIPCIRMSLPCKDQAEGERVN